MAIVKIISGTPTPPPPDAVILEMTRPEAEVVLKCLYQLGGPPAGRRGDGDRVLNALADAGVTCDEVEMYGSLTTTPPNSH